MEVQEGSGAGFLSNVFRVAKYGAIRAIVLFLMVTVAVYVTILIANYGGELDDFVKSEIEYAIGMSMKGMTDLTHEEKVDIFEERKAAAFEAAGLNVPFPLRCARWLKRGLTLDWGTTNISARGWGRREKEVRSVIFEHLPRTLLVFGTANVLLFITTILIALPLTTRRADWIDKFLIFLSPLSAAPAWAYGIIINLLALKTVGGLFTGGTFDAWPTEFRWAYIPILLRHMVVPLLAIYLNGLFHGIYTWRTLFQLYAREDYVELAQAKGLPAGLLGRRYILRPILPSLITSFVLLFAGLWQQVIILESFFNIAGIGRLFVTAYMSRRIPLVVAIVVTFGYLLAITIFVLDILYAIVDPRIKIDFQARKVQTRVKAPKLRLRLPWTTHRPDETIQAPEKPNGIGHLSHNGPRQASEALDQALASFAMLTKRRFSWSNPSGKGDDLLADRFYPELGIAVRFASASDAVDRNTIDGYRRWGIILLRMAPGEPVSRDTLRAIEASLSAAARKIAQGPDEKAIKRSLMSRIAKAKKTCRQMLIPSETPVRIEQSDVTGPENSRRTSPTGLGETLGLGARQLLQYPAAVVGMLIILTLVGVSMYTVITIPYDEMITVWREDQESWIYNPEDAPPVWINLFRRKKLPPTITLDSRSEDASVKTTSPVSEEMTEISITYPFNYRYDATPQDLALFINAQFDEKRPMVVLTWITPDGREVEFMSTSVKASTIYRISQDDRLTRKLDSDSVLTTLLSGSDQAAAVPLKGAHELRLTAYVFEEDADVDAKMVLYGQVHGLAGTDSRRRDLKVPLLWGMPIALAFGLLAAAGTSISSVLIAAVGTWFGGWVDLVVQRITEVNMILPFLPISVMIYVLYSKSFWMILGITVLLSIFGSSIKSYRAIFLQVREAPYVEAALSYGAGNWRIISRYLIPRITSVLVPQLVIMVPSYVFLEASLAFLGVSDPVLPTWGKLIVEGLSRGLYNSNYHLILEPLGLLMLVGFAFVMLGISLDRISKPGLRLQ